MQQPLPNTRMLPCGNPPHLVQPCSPRCGRSAQRGGRHWRMRWGRRRYQWRTRSPPSRPMRPCSKHPPQQWAPSPAGGGGRATATPPLPGYSALPTLLELPDTCRADGWAHLEWRPVGCEFYSRILSEFSSNQVICVLLCRVRAEPELLGSRSCYYSW